MERSCPAGALTSTMVQSFYEWLAFAEGLFVFDTPKRLLIQDWRLGLLLRTLQLLVLVYVIVEIFRERFYLWVEVPVG